MKGVKAGKWFKKKKENLGLSLWTYVGGVVNTFGIFCMCVCMWTQQVGFGRFYA